MESSKHVTVDSVDCWVCWRNRWSNTSCWEYALWCASWNHDSRARVSLVIVVMGTHSHAQDTSITLNHFAWTKFKSMQSTIAELLFLSGHLVNYNTVCHGNGTLIMDLMTWKAGYGPMAHGRDVYSSRYRSAVLTMLMISYDITPVQW